MSSQWHLPSPAPAPPPRGSTSALRSTAVIAAVAVAGAVGLVIWGGGEGPAVAGPDGGGPGVPTIPDDLTGDLAGESSGDQAGDGAATAAAIPGVAVATEGVTPGVAVATAAPAPGNAPIPPGDLGASGSYEAQVTAQDALIAALPVPDGLTEQPSDGAGVRTWTTPGTDWRPVRDAYLLALAGQGYGYVLTETIDEGANGGELYQLTAGTGITLQLAVGTFDGLTGIEVTRR